MIDNRDIAYAAILDNNIVGYIGFYVIGNQVIIAKNAQSFMKKQGILTALLEFAMKDTKFIIINDMEMTVDGANFWKSILKIPRFNPKILDLKYFDLYEITDIGQYTEERDNTQILNPEFDNRPEPNDISSIQSNEQRFFYAIAEAALTINHLKKINETKKAAKPLKCLIHEHENTVKKIQPTILPKIFKYGPPWI